MKTLGRMGLGAGVTAAICIVSAPAFAQENQIENGVAVEAEFSVRYLATSSLTNAKIGPPEVAPGLFVGYKLNRAIFGLGLEFANSTSSSAMTAGTGANAVTTTTTVSDSVFLIGPEFQFAAVRSADQRVELIVDLSLHFGHEFQSTSVSVTPPPATTPPANNAPTPSNFLLSYRLGPGLRFWAHRHFALQAITGFTGQAFFDLPVSGTPATGNNSQHSIFTAIGALGAF